MKVDAQTIDAFAQGDHEAFRALFKAFYPKVCAFVHGFVKDPDDAEDVVQLVFIKLWEKRQHFLRVHHLDAYLYQLTKYTMLNFIRTKSIVPPMTEVTEQVAENEYTQEEELEAKDLRLIMEMVVENMPPQRRTIFKLSRMEGLSNEEIAQRLGIQKKTVENHLNLALKELKQALLLSLILLTIWGT